MARTPKLEFAASSTPPKGVLILFCEEGVKFGQAARKVLDPTGDLVSRAATAEGFKGKSGSILDIVAPADLGVTRLIVIGAGKVRDLKSQDFVKLGGSTMGRVPAAANLATVLVDLPGGMVRPERAADVALGVQLRAYGFERYKTKRKDDEEPSGEVRVIVAVAEPTPHRYAFSSTGALLIEGGRRLDGLQGSEWPDRCLAMMSATATAPASEKCASS